MISNKDERITLEMYKFILLAISFSNRQNKSSEKQNSAFDSILTVEISKIRLSCAKFTLL